MRLSFFVLVAWTAMASGGDMGIDVSHHNSVVDWAKVKAAGIKFAAAKATEGTTFKDGQFLQNWRGMKQNGIRAAAYHYLRGAQSASLQVSNIKSVLQQCNFGANDILVIDVEQGSNEGVSASNMATTLNAMLLELKVLYNNIYIYTGPYYWEDKVAWKMFDFSPYNLWIAHYTNNPAPRIPTSWKAKGYTWWQYTDKGSVDGVNGFVDMDRSK